MTNVLWQYLKRISRFVMKFIRHSNDMYLKVKSERIHNPPGQAEFSSLQIFFLYKSGVLP